jgi:uncharacterized protein YhbP (UPF0306 family)
MIRHWQDGPSTSTKGRHEYYTFVVAAYAKPTSHREQSAPCRINVQCGVNDERKELEEVILEYLTEHNAMSLATASNGSPHAASVFYVNDGFDLYFMSSPHSRHGENFANNDRVSATINEDYCRWADIKGLQLEGKVETVGGLLGKEKIATAFIGKFPDVRGFFKNPGDMADSIADKVKKVKFYRFRSAKIYYIDNSLGFGHRDAIEFGKS